MTEVRCLRKVYAAYPHFYVLNDHAKLPLDMLDCTYFITHSERDLKTFYNMVELLRIYRRERPRVMLSTGAGPAVPAAIVGRYFFGMRIIFIETITRIGKPSLTGRLMYWLADDFFFQWEALSTYFPKGRHIGPVA